MTSPDASLFKKITFNLFLINGTVAQKSELTEELLSKLSPIRQFHKELDLKTKLFLEISNAMLLIAKCKQRNWDMRFQNFE